MKLFIADIHLKPDTNPTNEAFKAFLEGPAQDASELYILGDLFDAWIGDDIGLELFKEPIQWLKAYADKIPTFFLPGNRDFLIGSDFYKATGITPISDPYVLQLGTQKALLKHADDLCTEDADYQSFRQISRTDQWKAEFLTKTPEERIAIAQHLRSESQRSTQEKSMEIMDVNPNAVSSDLTQYSAQILIHGHTHRPAVHTLPNGIRIDVGDWSEKGGHYAAWSNNKLKLLKFNR